MTLIVETKQLDGQRAYRRVGTPAGAWTVCPAPIDAVLSYLQAELRCTRQDICRGIGLDTATVSRIRTGERLFCDKWLLRLADFSGVPVAELRQVAGTVPEVAPHPRARRSI